MRVWFVLILFVLMSACAPTSTLPSNPTLSVTSVAISAPTPSRVPIATEVPTATATDTSTPTNTATSTQTPTNTLTQTPAIPDWQYTNTAIMQTLAAAPTRTQTPRPIGLRDLAARYGITIGTEFQMGAPSNSRYSAIMHRDFNVATLSEFACSKGWWLGRGKYDFSQIDRVVNFVLSQGWQVRVFHLVWGATETPCGKPDWLANGNFSRDDYVQILQEYVKAVVGHFKGRVAEWSIANEAIGRSFCGGGCDYWMDEIGPDYIEIAFRAAREADPNAVLIFNNDDNDSPRDEYSQRNIEKLYETVKTLKGNGVPIDVIGMQMHFLLPWQSQTIPNKQTVISTMQKFAELGVVIYVTELDVNLTNVAGTRAEKWQYEADLFHDMMAACIESGVCKSFATWGVSDSTSWVTCLNDGCVKQPNGDPLMFDKDFQPKPAYFAVRDALLGK